MEKKLTTEELTQLNGLFHRSCNGVSASDTLLTFLKELLTRDDPMGIEYFLDMRSEVEELGRQCYFLQNEPFNFARIDTVGSMINSLQEALAHFFGGVPSEYLVSPA